MASFATLQHRGSELSVMIQCKAWSTCKGVAPSITCQAYMCHGSAGVGNSAQWSSSSLTRRAPVPHIPHTFPHTPPHLSDLSVIVLWSHKAAQVPCLLQRILCDTEMRLIAKQLALVERLHALRVGLGDDVRQLALGVEREVAVGPQLLLRRCGRV